MRLNATFSDPRGIPSDTTYHNLDSEQGGENLMRAAELLKGGWRQVTVMNGLGRTITYQKERA
jgi:hypothetical protein